MEYEKLQNGSDIRGIAIDGGEGKAVNLTDEAVFRLTAAFARWLSQKTGAENPRIAIGRDSRLSGPALLKSALKGVFSSGGKPTSCELSSTPAMFMTTVMDGYKYDGSIMITASHMPYIYNGLKFFSPKGGLEKEDIKDIIAIADDIKYESVAPSFDTIDFMSVYSKHLCDIIKNTTGKDKPLLGLHIIVDAGNGAGGFFAGKVLEPLGADISGSLYLDPDGHFPNHIPNPENSVAAACIQRAVIENKADFGIIFDTDVDRAGGVLSNGELLTRNSLIAILSHIALDTHPHTTIVTDSVTSTGLADYIKRHGGVHHRFKRGYRNVINEAIRLNNEGVDSQLAIETSGHGAFKENYFLDDGAYLMVKLLCQLGKGISLSDMIADLKQPKESYEFRMNINASDFKAYGGGVLNKLNSYIPNVDGWSLAPNNYEGIRVNCDESSGDGWFLLRMSLHEPLMPLNIESDVADGTQVIAKILYKLLREESELDISPLTDFIK